MVFKNVFFNTMQIKHNYKLTTMLFLTSFLESTSSNDLIKPFFTQLFKKVFTIDFFKNHLYTVKKKSDMEVANF